MRTRRQYLVETSGGGRIDVAGEVCGRVVILEMRHALSATLSVLQAGELIRALDKALTDLDRPDERP